MKNNIPYNVLANRANDWDRVPRGPMAVALGGALGFSTATLFGGSAITLFGGTAFAMTLSTASVIGTLVISAVSSWAMKALMPKMDFGSATSSQGLLVNSREATGPQHYVYGRVRKGGTVSYYESTGSNNKYLHQIIVLAGHEIESVDNIYLNDDVIALDSNGFVTDDRWKDDSGNSKVRIYYHLGNQTLATDNFANVSGKDLANTLIAESELTGDDALDSNFKGAGLAFMYVRYEYEKDVFANGVPTITAEIEGKKVFDPRNVNHVSNDPSTWAYSNNAALCIRDFLVSEYGLNDDNIDETSFAAAANECDEDVTIYSTTTEKRYTLDGVVDASRPVGGVLGDMVTSCAGTLFYGAGKWMLKAGAYTTPVKTFTDDDFRSGIALDTKASMRDTFNAVQGVYVSKDNNYISSDYPQVSDATYLSADNGEESILDLPLPYTTSVYAAQRLAKLTLLRGRKQMVFNADFSTEALEVEVGDIVQITHARYGFSNKTFEVLSWQLGVSDGGGLIVKMTLQETDSAAFAWNTADASGPTVKATIVPSVENNAAVGQVTATNTGYIDGDGTFVSRLTFDWPDVVGGNFDHYEFDHKLSTASTYETVITSKSLVSLTGYKKNDTVNYRIRTVNASGVAGAYTSVGSIIVTGDTTAPNAPTGLSATGAFRAVSLEWTNPTVSDFSHVQVWRSTSSSSASATKIAETSANYYVDAPLSGGVTYYYWLKSVDFSENVSGFSSGANAAGSNLSASDIPEGAITETKILDDSISTAKIQANAISANQLAVDSVTAGAIQAGAVTAAKVAADAIDAEKINVTSLSAISANMGTLTAGNIQLGNLTVNSTNMIPTGGAGFRLEGDGDLAFGTVENHMAFDVSTGKLTIQGEIVNIRDDAIEAQVAGMRIFDLAGNYTLTNAFTAGWYTFALVGGGGGGGGSYTYNNNSFSTSGSGGGAGGMAIWTMYMDGVSTVNVTLGAGGGVNFGYGGENIGNGNAGGASNFVYGNSTIATANGGSGGIGGNNNIGTNGGTANMNLNPSNDNNVLYRAYNSNAAKGGGGSAYGVCGSGGGGVVVPTMELYSANLTGRSADCYSNSASVGGSMVGSQANSGSNNNNTVLGIANATYDPAAISAPIFNGSYIGLGGNAESSTSGYAGVRRGNDGGIFAGGGGEGGGGSGGTAFAGNGGIGAGGGGAGGLYTRTAGSGGSGAIFWRKL